MPELRTKHASLIVNGKRAGEFYGVTYVYNTGDEVQFGDAGAEGFSDGAGNTTLDARAFHPVGGMSVPDFYAAAQQKQTFDIALELINGSIHQVPMRCVKGQTTSEVKNGTQLGEYSFVGLEPKIT